MKLRIASLSLLTVCCLMLAVAPAMADTLYNNGPLNGSADAWTINFGFSVSDSFQVANNSSIQGLHFNYWDDQTTDVVTTVDMQIGSTSFGGSTQTLTGVTNTFLGFSPFGFALFQAERHIHRHFLERRWVSDPIERLHHLWLLCDAAHLLG